MKLGNIMKQAQEMQEKMQKMQEELQNILVEGVSGGGMVKVSMTAKGDMKTLTIDPSIVNAEEVDILEDLIVAACNDARAKAEAKSAEEMQGIAGGLPLPPGMKLPF